MSAINTVTTASSKKPFVSSSVFGLKIQENDEKCFLFCGSHQYFEEKKYIITCSINLAVLKKAFLKKKIFKSSTYILCCFQFSSAICRILRKLNNVLLLFYLFLCVHIKKTKINKEGSPIYKKTYSTTFYSHFIYGIIMTFQFLFTIDIDNPCFTKNDYLCINN